MISSPASITKIHAQYRAGELTPRELLEQCLNRIDSREADVKAWVRIDREGAIQLADEQTRLLAGLSPSEALPPLFGIPIAVKDIIDVETWPTLAGSPLREKHVAAADAPAVTRLRQAGAIMLGKTVTTQFASFDPSPTRNPWQLSHTPGGSSSGSAAAVACSMCVAAIGTQTGGSIIRPASYCGVVGFKPTFGRVPLEGVVPLAPSMDHVGALAKNVSDVARVYGVLSDRVSGSQSAVLHDGPIRFGVLWSFFVDQAEAEAAAVFDAVMVHLENMLGPVTTVELEGDIAELHRAHRTVMGYECAAYHRHDFLAQRDQYAPFISQLIEEGLATSPENYAQALDRGLSLRAQTLKLLESCDVLVMPSTSGPAPTIETTGDPRWQNVWSFARLPAITIPCGFAAMNLPLGLQLVAADDAPLLKIAATCEDALDLGSEIERLMG